jgi:hypothetical protein
MGCFFVSASHGATRRSRFASSNAPVSPALVWARSRSMLVDLVFQDRQGVAARLRLADRDLKG